LTYLEDEKNKNSRLPFEKGHFICSEVNWQPWNFVVTGILNF